MTDRPRRNTRRGFLASSALGALAAVATGGTASATAETVDPTFRVGCSLVRVDDWGDADGARVVYRDGSYVDVGDPGREEPERFGSPGRMVESVAFDTPDGTVGAESDADGCDPGEKAVTFTDSRATVRAGEFVDVDGYPGRLVSQVDVDFVDGTSQEKVHHDGPPTHNGLTGVYRGTGEHEGKVVEAVRVFYDLHYVSHYVRNPAADKHLLGKDSCRDRLVEVVGATEGAVDYEFTVDGPVRGVDLADGRGAGSNDSVSEGRDTWTVLGTTGNPGYSDVYAVNGEITSFTQTGGDGDYVLREAEWRILADTAPATDLLSVVATEPGEVEYEFAVDGTVRAVENACETRSAGADDEVSDDDGVATVEGSTGNAGYGDTYAVTGDVTDFDRTGGDAGFRIDYNGHEVTPDELVADH